MAAIDITAPSGQLIEYVEIEITNEGYKPHVEFCNISLAVDNGQMVDLPREEQKRGVYGYVGFGFGGVVPGRDGTLKMFWQEARFINWGRNIFYPPDRVPTENVRVWCRALVYANIHVEYIAQTAILSPTWHFAPPP